MRLMTRALREFLGRHNIRPALVNKIQVVCENDTVAGLCTRQMQLEAKADCTPIAAAGPDRIEFVGPAIVVHR